MDNRQGAAQWSGQPFISASSAGSRLELAQQVFDNSSEAIFVSDLQGNLLEVNAAACRLAKYSREEMLKLRNVDIVAQEDQSRIAPELAQCDEGQIAANRWLLLCSDGTTVPLDLVVQRLPGDLYLATGRDLTDRENALRQLAQARDIAEASSRSKSRFLAAASHDLRQPMQAIGLLLHALQQTGLNARQQDIANSLEASTQALDQLLSALLDVSRLDAGVVKISPEVVSIHTVLRRMANEFGDIAERKMLRFTVRFPSEELLLHTDSGLLQSVLRNLLSNAFRYTETGGVLIAVRQRTTHICVQVWDTGIGIDPAHSEQIYDEFFQANNNHRDRTLGFGLGLSIVKRLVELLGFKVGHRSQPQVGSVFEICIDRQHLLPPQTAIAPPAALPTPATAAAIALQKRIVLIEDDVLVVEAWRNWFEACEAEAIIFSQASDALIWSTHNHADVYVSDLRLPGGMNGIELLDAIQQQCKHQIAGIIVTGDTSSEVIQRLAGTRWQVLHKPVQVSLLLDLIVNT